MLPGPCDLKYKRCNLHTFSSYFFKRVQPVKTVRLSRRKPQTGSFIVTYEFSKDINTFFNWNLILCPVPPACKSICLMVMLHKWNGKRMWSQWEAWLKPGSIYSRPLYRIKAMDRSRFFFFFFRSWIIFIFIFKRRMRKESRVPASKGAFVVLKNMYLPRRGLKCLHITLLT